MLYNLNLWRKHTEENLAIISNLAVKTKTFRTVTGTIFAPPHVCNFMKIFETKFLEDQPNFLIWKWGYRIVKLLLIYIRNSSLAHRNHTKCSVVLSQTLHLSRLSYTERVNLSKIKRKWDHSWYGENILKPDWFWKEESQIQYRRN